MNALGLNSEEAEPATWSMDEAEPAAGYYSGSDSSVLSGDSDAHYSPNTAMKLVNAQHGEQVRAFRIISRGGWFEREYKDWPLKYILQALKHGLFNTNERREVLNTFVYKDRHENDPGIQIQSTATTTTAASGEKKDAEGDDGNLKPAAASSLIGIREEAEEHKATCGGEMWSGGE